MWLGWMSYGCNEIINEARLAGYTASYGIEIDCDPCVGLAQALGDGLYRSPTDDPAPWVDPLIPESTRFLGVMGTSQVGMDAGGPALTGAPREFTVTMLLVATDQLGLGYGLAWLTAALRPDSCNAGVCDGLPLCVFAACPTCDGGTCGDREQRTAYDVRVIDGPDVTTRYDLEAGAGCTGVAATVEVTFRARVPYWYRMPVTAGTITPAGSAIQVPGPRTVDGSLLCPPPRSCLYDPSCDLQPPVPNLPVGPQDPCWPSIPDGSYSAYRATLAVAASAFPQWLSAVPVITVTPGTASLHWVQVLFYVVPSTGSGFSCATLRDHCKACALLAVTYVPKGGVLTLDGRLPAAITACGDKVSAEPTPVVGFDGSGVDWPVFPCGQAVCMEVLVKAETGSNDASVVLALAAREDTL